MPIIRPKIIFYSVLFTYLLFLQNCESDSSTDPVILNSYTDSESLEIPFENIRSLDVQNKLGGVLVSGWSDSSMIRAYLFKTIGAQNQTSAQQHFQNIQLKTEIVGNEFITNIVYPENSDVISYRKTSLSLDIPYSTNCEIISSNGPIHISQLIGEILIENTEHEVEIQNHVGSCIVNSSSNISAILSLPDSLSCLLTTTSGNINLKIPEETNAVINIQSPNGSISYSDFNFIELDVNDNKLDAVLGNGSAVITLISESGKIKLEKL